MYYFKVASLASTASMIKDDYLPLIKSRQTLLLVFTAIAGYLSQPFTHIQWWLIFNLAGSLLISIGGCTVLNMLIDRDIDYQMERTRHRPLADGRVDSLTAAWMGAGLLLAGLLWAALLSTPFFGVVFLGACLNVLVYTTWLKRRTAWSIFWGGIAGGMPILAGRVLASGQVDLLGLLLALVIVLWIPSHNLTLSMLYSGDYHHAGVPTVLNTYGEGTAHLVTVISSILVAIIFMLVFTRLGLQAYELGLIFALCFGLIILAVLTWMRPSRKHLTVEYKYSSLFLLVSCIFLVLSRII